MCSYLLDVELDVTITEQFQQDKVHTTKIYTKKKGLSVVYFIKQN